MRTKMRASTTTANPRAVRDTPPLRRDSFLLLGSRRLLMGLMDRVGNNVEGRRGSVGYNSSCRAGSSNVISTP